MTKSRVLVIGAGALGSFFAFRLSQSGQDVSIIARGERLGQIRRHGLRLSTGGSTQVAKVQATDNALDTPRPDWIFVCTKTGSFKPALSAVRSTHKMPGAIVTVQNGVDAPAWASELYSEVPILAGRVHGFFELTDGIVHHVGVDPSVYFGLTYGPEDGSEKRLLELLTGAGIEASIVPDANAALWEKALITVAAGGAAAATGRTVGEIMANGDARRLFESALAEIVAVARGLGICLPPDAIVKTVQFVSTFPIDATTSMQRDLEAGVPSEYADLVGAVLKKARDMRVPVPALQRIEAMITARGLDIAL